MNKEKLKKIIEDAGAIYIDIQESFKENEEPWIMFNNLEGYTCYLHPSKITIKAVERKLIEKQKEIDFYKKGEEKCSQPL